MIKLLRGASVIVAAIFVAYFFLIDGIIKPLIEREGSQALQAPLAIGKVTLHLISTSISLRDVQLGNARLPTHNLVEIEDLSLPFSLRDLLAHKLIVETLDIHGLRFNRPRAQQTETAPTNTANAADTKSVTHSPQLREALQRVRQTLNSPLASNTINPNASITGALLADQFKPLLTQLTTALNALTTASSDLGDWQILLRHVNLDGALDLGPNSTNNNRSLHFTGVVDNVTPQPKLFDVATQIDVSNVEGEPATLHISGSLDKRKLTQATLRFDLANFSLTQWPIIDDPELKISIVNANAGIQAVLSLTGNQFDFNALTHFQQARFDIAHGSDDITRVVADVWRRTDAFDINLQASGDLANPVLKLNSSLDVPLANAIQQLQTTSPFPQTAPFSASP